MAAIYSETNSFYEILPLTESSSGLSFQPIHGELILVNKIIALLQAEPENMSYIQDLLKQAITLHPASETLQALQSELNVLAVG